MQPKASNWELKQAAKELLAQLDHTDMALDKETVLSLHASISSWHHERTWVRTLKITRQWPRMQKQSAIIMMAHLWINMVYPSLYRRTLTHDETNTVMSVNQKWSPITHNLDQTTLHSFTNQASKSADHHVTSSITLSDGCHTVKP